MQVIGNLYHCMIQHDARLPLHAKSTDDKDILIFEIDIGFFVLCFACWSAYLLLFVGSVFTLYSSLHVKIYSICFSNSDIQRPFWHGIARFGCFIVNALVKTPRYLLHFMRTNCKILIKKAANNVGDEPTKIYNLI